MKKWMIISILFITGCGAPERPKTNTSVLEGTGASFPLPLYDLLFRSYTKKTGQKIHYDIQNSDIGVQAIIAGTVDFGTSDVPMTDEEIRSSEAEILHIPIAAAGVNFTYNIPEPGFGMLDDPVYLTPEIIYKIYAGQITKWNDPQIVSLNQQVAEDKTRTFPNIEIIPIYRHGKSGTTYLFSQFMAKASSNWKKRFSISKEIAFPKGIGQTNSLDVMKSIISTPGSFGYTTMIYAFQNGFPVARIRNALGTYVRGCNFRSKEAMKVSKTNIDNRVDITYPNEGKEAAVAASLMYVLVRKEQNYNNRSKEQAQALVDLLAWTLSPEAQKQFDSILFASLTPKFRSAAQATLKKITYNNEPLTPTIDISSK
ncbi:phosphate transport system substrate-binding protein [Brevinema andersonii]|uniref:Phosphate-binding protein n=1 Tax=Brevinema andersonii TaxID=34097 RepID=A0A1I1F2L1_BREAD|nr:phosphate ABC transporter substrate-binding protein PstS [Brevinema andersonii]SFB91400.1 phosphate transport system substrate-binding protein [Brevinema andersonii]